MKRILKWAALALVVVVFCGLLAFLYFIPPFFSTPQEEFTRAMREAPPPVTDIADPAERTIAARGRDIVMRTGCIGCHATNGPQGPDSRSTLPVEASRSSRRSGTFVSRNLTPDPDTGLARRSDEEVKRVLRSGVFPDGHVAPYTVMPWANFSNWTEEDRHAVRGVLAPPQTGAAPDSGADDPAGGARSRRHRAGLRVQGLRVAVIRASGFGL